MRIAAADMVDPDRRVNQDHAGVGRRRGTCVAAVSLPASTLPLDQGLECLTNQSGLSRPGQALGFLDEFVIQGEGRSYGRLQAR